MDRCRNTIALTLPIQGHIDPWRLAVFPTVRCHRPAEHPGKCMAEYGGPPSAGHIAWTPTGPNHAHADLNVVIYLNVEGTTITGPGLCGTADGSD